jgi:hypothetical protein
MATHGDLHRVWILLPQAGGTLEVGEDEGHRARWWYLGHAQTPRSQESPRVAAEKWLRSAIGHRL